MDCTQSLEIFIYPVLLSSATACRVSIRDRNAEKEKLNKNQSFHKTSVTSADGLLGVSSCIESLLLEASPRPLASTNLKPISLRTGPISSRKCLVALANFSSFVDGGIL